MVCGFHLSISSSFTFCSVVPFLPLNPSLPFLHSFATVGICVSAFGAPSCNPFWFLGCSLPSPRSVSVSLSSECCSVFRFLFRGLSCPFLFCFLASSVCVSQSSFLPFLQSVFVVRFFGVSLGLLTLSVSLSAVCLLPSLFCVRGVQGVSPRMPHIPVFTHVLSPW